MATSVCDITRLRICSASSCPFRWFEAHAHDLNAFLLFSLVTSLSRLLVCLCCSFTSWFHCGFQITSAADSDSRGTGVEQWMNESCVFKPVSHFSRQCELFCEGQQFCTLFVKCVFFTAKSVCLFYDK